MTITKDILYVGVNDHDVDLFEGQYVVPNGMSYNSYVILDEKIAVMDTVDQNFTQQWLDNVAAVLMAASPIIWLCITWSPTILPISMYFCRLSLRLWWCLLPRLLP